MNVDDLLGIDLNDPEEQHIQALVEADERLLDDLIRLRKRRRMSQADVAAKLGCNQSVIARIEGGDRDPHLSTLRRYAFAIGGVVEHRVEDFQPTRYSMPAALVFGEQPYAASWDETLTLALDRCNRRDFGIASRAAR